MSVPTGQTRELMDDQGGLRLGDIRYMLIRPDVLMGIFTHLPEEMVSHVFEAFAKSVEENGGKSVQSYRGEAAENPKDLLQIVAQTAPKLGWGLWEISERQDGFTLRVEHSPFVAGHGPAERPVCSAIEGMLSALACSVYGKNAVVREENCGAVTGSEYCEFRVHIAKE